MSFSDCTSIFEGLYLSPPPKSDIAYLYRRNHSVDQGLLAHTHDKLLDKTILMIGNLSYGCFIETVIG